MYKQKKIPVGPPNFVQWHQDYQHWNGATSWKLQWEIRLKGSLDDGCRHCYPNRFRLAMVRICLDWATHIALIAILSCRAAPAICTSLYETGLTTLGKLAEHMKTCCSTSMIMQRGNCSQCNLPFGDGATVPHLDWTKPCDRWMQTNSGMANANVCVAQVASSFDVQTVNMFQTSTINTRPRACPTMMTGACAHIGPTMRLQTKSTK